MFSINGCKKKRSRMSSPASTASTVSVDDETQLLPELKRTKRLDPAEFKFDFPLSKEVRKSIKENKEISRKAREQLIRETTKLAFKA